MSHFRLSIHSLLEAKSNFLGFIFHYEMFEELRAVSSIFALFVAQHLPTSNGDESSTSALSSGTCA